jgi:hypothetical protein
MLVLVDRHIRKLLMFCQHVSYDYGTHVWLCKSNVIVLSHLGTPLGTPQGTPVGTPRGSRDTGGDSSDTLSETDSQKSLRMRRKLPSIPSNQEAISLPSSKRR